jgi:ATP-binding cassette subfamily B protein
MKNNLKLTKGELVASEDIKSGKIVPRADLRMELYDVSFGYEGGGLVIENAFLKFEAGKTYALVGPTGGGKSTLVSIMAHLYDPLGGAVFLNGRDICEYSHEERAKEISVILQDPLLFTGTVADNIRYGNDALREVDDNDLKKILDMKGFGEVVERFDGGLQSIVQASGGGLSIGQKQLISFMRAILREPKLLILDEATANIDTVTEAILNKTLEALPKDTTKVIIAHRLNTIKDADEIMFVNGHHVTLAGSFENAIKLIESSKRNS